MSYEEYRQVREEARKALPVEGLRTKGGDGSIDAYYFGFDPTGVPEIDRILQAVASAGCGSHHTDDWSVEGYVNGAGEKGVISPADAIQEYAERAAKAWRETNEPNTTPQSAQE